MHPGRPATAWLSACRSKSHQTPRGPEVPREQTAPSFEMSRFHACTASYSRHPLDSVTFFQFGLGDVGQFAQGVHQHLRTYEAVGINLAITQYLVTL